jgi:hypothetical protein
VGALFFEFVGQVDYGQCLERTLSHADAATNTELLHHDRTFVFKAYGFNVASYWRTKPIADSTTTLGFASFFVKNSDSNHVFSPSSAQ